MYFPVGWPKVVSVVASSGLPLHLVSNRDKILFATLTADSLLLWFCKPCVPIVYHKRSDDSILRLGTNVNVEWKPDSSMLCITTSEGHLILYNVEPVSGQTSAYQQSDPPSANLRRDSAELFVKEIIPPLQLVLNQEVLVWDGAITKLSCISGSEIMVCTTRGHLLRYRWDGSLNRDYCLDLRRIPFCVNQQVSKAIPIVEENTHVSDIEYSPLVGGFGITLNDGRAAFLTATTLKFDPNQVQGIWAQGIEDSTCTTVNHKYRSIAFGRKNSHVDVFTVDETTGGLECSHSMILSSKDFPGSPGAVKCMRWTADGRALAVAWSGGGVSVWSTFGGLLMCSLGWDYGLNQDLSKYNPLNVYSMEWCTEGYQLWMIRECKEISMSLIQLDFVKSALTVNPCMNHQSHLYLQADDRLYVNIGDSITKATHNMRNGEVSDEVKSETAKDDPSTLSYSPNMDNDNVVVGEFANEDADSFTNSNSNIADGKHWIVLPLPATYSATNWPIRYSAIDASGQNLCVAGRTGIAHYNMVSRKWKLFGNETQEKDFVVTGGMLWWRDYIVVGCFSILDGNDELRLYPRDTKLDNKFAKIFPIQSQVLLLDMLEDQIIIFGADAQISIYSMRQNDAVGDVEIDCIQFVDLAGLCVHPACVVSVSLSDLRHETTRQSHHTILTNQTVKPAFSMIVNVSGRLILVQREQSEQEDVNENPIYNCLPASVLASCVESVWAARCASPEQPHLTSALWLWCGALGMRVWLPLFPVPPPSSIRHGSLHPSSHTFMSKRIMLPFHLKIYPLAILFEDAIILGAENDTLLYSSDSNSVFSLPFCVLNRTSQVYLHQILRQLLRRNLGYHAWEIARSCSNLPYFPHSLELLLHEVLEEEATSKDPIPDAQLPSVIEFIQVFPVYLQTVVQCARKTEIALWAYLFNAAGKPKELFQMCLNMKMLDTAASYLIILQNLESSSVSRQLATVLLDTALLKGRWDLARDLVRFLRAIDPNDLESPRTSIIMGSKFTINPQAPPVSPNAEDLSVILGNMQVSRGRSFSTTVTPRVNMDNTKHGTPEVVTAASNTVSTNQSHDSKRKKSVPTGRTDRDSTCSGTAEEFFIDVMLHRHARRLLSAGRMWQLGHFASRLDFHLVAWLGTERERAARVENAVTCLKLLHDDFHWPYPSLQQSTPSFVYNGNTSLVPSTPSPTEPSSYGGDSGYVSLAMGASEINCLGRDLQVGPAMSVVSETEALSVWGEGERQYAALMDRLSHQQAETGSHRSEVQLRYLLQLMTEAGCVEWSFLIAFILRDAMAVLRTTNAARSSDISVEAVGRLKKAFQDLCSWIDTECLGYKPFMLAIQNQVPVLCTILKNRERRHTNTAARTTPPSNQVKGHHQQETVAPASPVAPDASISNNVQNNLDFANSKLAVVRKESPKLIDTRQCQESVSTSNKVSEQGNCVVS
ncbi:guanine nucleotide exchange factor subunit Rich [Arctopsyche grandis]|uniref:guanine nucleotide exchange factor subunit Rich n=1 Tax=Arctopsyche grandis TaxID=121162 RepID=UPI00406D6C05